MGQVAATPDALQVLAEHYTLAEDLLERHTSGDWGDLDAEDAQRNNEALVDGSCVLSAYILAEGVRVWIITEAQNDEGVRSYTTLLLPSEY